MTGDVRGIAVSSVIPSDVPEVAVGCRLLRPGRSRVRVTYYWISVL